MNNKNLTNTIIILSILLSLIGIVMIYSSSMIWAEYKLGNQYYYLIRQTLFFIIGVLCLFIFKNINLDILYKKALLIFLICLLLLIIVLIPFIGVVRGGSRSWIGIGSFSIQPAEFMKIGLVIYISKYLSINYKDLKTFKGLIGLLILIAIVFFLIMLEPDFGTCMVIALGVFSLIFMSGLNAKYVVISILLGLILVIALIISAPYRFTRITAFLDPWSDPLGAGFQSIQSLYAIVPSGIFGLGLFNSRQKFYYLPEPQTDFIFAIIIEELGLIGAVIIFILFLVLFYNCLLISLRQENLFYQNLSFGFTIMLFFQFFINIGVVIGLLPVTGVTLPFLSYGGSSLVINFIMIGIISNISSNSNYKNI